MIALFTDYGLQGPYIGQVEAVLHARSPQTRVINLMADAPANNPKAAAYLLAALSAHLPAGTIFFSVVDPGVGSFEDLPVVLNTGSRWYAGPDNGLFDIVARTATDLTCRRISWLPERLSASFHGRDLYAPICAMLANHEDIPGQRIDWQDRHHWPDQLSEIIYIDHFGNCMTGINAASLDTEAVLRAGVYTVRHALTFSAVGVGELFWYENSIGLVEIAANCADASRILGASIGDRIIT